MTCQQIISCMGDTSMTICSFVYSVDDNDIFKRTNVMDNIRPKKKFKGQIRAFMFVKNLKRFYCSQVKIDSWRLD